MNEELIRKALAERGMKKEDIDLVIKQASAEGPKQEDPKKEENPAEGSKEDPKQEGGEPDKPVEDKPAEGGGEPSPKQEGAEPNNGAGKVDETKPEEKPAGNADYEILKRENEALRNENKEIKGSLDGLTSRLTAFEKLFADKFGTPANGDQRDVGGNAEIEHQDAGNDLMAEYERQKRRAGKKI